MPVANSRERVRRPGHCSGGSTPSLGIPRGPEGPGPIGPPTPPPDPLELTSAAAAAAAAAVAAFRLSPNSCSSPRRNQETAGDSIPAATASKKRRHDGSVVQDGGGAFAMPDLTQAADGFQTALTGSRPGSRYSSVRPFSFFPHTNQQPPFISGTL